MRHDPHVSRGENTWNIREKHRTTMLHILKVSRWHVAGLFLSVPNLPEDGRLSSGDPWGPKGWTSILLEASSYDQIGLNH